MTSTGQTILWPNAAYTAAQFSERDSGIDDFLSRTLYGCFVVPAADAPEPGNIKVEYKIRTGKESGEDVKECWKQLEEVSIGAARKPEWFKKNSPSKVERASNFKELVGPVAVYAGEIKDDSGNVVKSMIRRYSVDESENSAAVVRQQFDLDWGAAIAAQGINPYDDNLFKGGLDFDAHEVVVVYGAQALGMSERVMQVIESERQCGFRLMQVIENDTSVVLQIEPSGIPSGAAHLKTLEGTPYAMLVLPRSKRKLHVELNIGGRVSKGDSTKSFEKRAAWYPLNVSGKSVK